MAELGLPGGVNPLDFLHKLATQRGLPRPDFVQVGEQGLPHNKVFVWQCSFYQVVAQGSGRSKKEAKVAAARAVRDQLNFNELPPPPTFQSQMERKLKRRLNSNGDFAGNGAESAKAQKYDYSLHFQCYRYVVNSSSNLHRHYFLSPIFQWRYWRSCWSPLRILTNGTKQEQRWRSNRSF